MQGKVPICVAILFSGISEKTFCQFHFKEPSGIYQMPKELLEISGLTFIDENNVATEQDEAGIIFIYNLQDKKVVKQISFGPKGDYEDIAIVGKNVYVMNSTGSLYEVRNFQSEKPEVKNYTFSAANESNAEAMCSDAKNNRLLISFKESTGPKSSQKSIYAFDLLQHKISETLVLTISLDDILQHMNKGKKKGGKKIQRAAGIDKVFAPSCMSINPKDGNIYLISSHNKILLIVDEKGKIIKSYQLPRSLFRQPEGITFSSSGDLYISNEGNRSKGNILKFVYGQ